MSANVSIASHKSHKPWDSTQDLVHYWLHRGEAAAAAMVDGGGGGQHWHSGATEGGLERTVAAIDDNHNQIKYNIRVVWLMSSTA